MRVFQARGRVWAKAVGLVVTQWVGTTASVAENGRFMEIHLLCRRVLHFDLKITGNGLRILLLTGCNMIAFPFQKVHTGGLFRKVYSDEEGQVKTKAGEK